MAVKGTAFVKGDNGFCSYTNALKSAACEWLLLFLLLLDAAFSYFITKFAQYCELQLPCILCSRLDHVIGNDKPEFYRHLICTRHRSEISSLVLCHNHFKLADVHEMCEECLLSFAKKEASQEMYKILVGKLGSDCLQKPFLSIDSVPGPMSTRFCSCCAKSWRSRPNVHKFVQSPAPVSKPDIPLPKSPARRLLNRQEGLKKRKDRLSVSATPIPFGSEDFDSLSHVGYTEVKIHSDSESDFPFSDDEEMTTVPRDRRNLRVDRLSQRDSKMLTKKHLDDFSHAGVFHKSSHLRSNNVMCVEPGKGETTTAKFSESNGDVKHEETSWQLDGEKASIAVPECTSLEDIPLSASAPEISPALSADEGERVTRSKKLSAFGLHDLVFHNNASLVKTMQSPVKLSKEKWANAKENGDIEHTSTVNSWESIDLNSNTTPKGIRNDSLRKEALSMHNSSATGAGDISPSCRKNIKFSEQLGRRDSNGTGSVSEPTTSKASLAPQPNPSLCAKNHTVNGHADEMQMADVHSSIGSPVPPESPSLERSHSLESLEGSLCEIEGENIVDKLKRQVEHDKQCISNLYKELEEERNAAAIAANQAMAMITKLQEEKSALHMEALQYLRMMEEQAEYDVDELDRANDILAEKEKEIQDLEAELDYFRIKYRDDFPEDYGMLEQSMDVNDALTSNMESINNEES